MSNYRNPIIYGLRKTMPNRIMIIPIPYKDKEDLLLAQYCKVDVCFFLSTQDSVEQFYNIISGATHFCFDMFNNNSVFLVNKENGNTCLSIINQYDYQVPNGIITLKMETWIKRLSRIIDCACFDLRINKLLYP